MAIEALRDVPSMPLIDCGTDRSGKIVAIKMSSGSADGLAKEQATNSLSVKHRSLAVRA